MTTRIITRPTPSAMAAVERFRHPEPIPSNPDFRKRVANAVSGTVAILFGLAYYGMKIDFLIRHLLTDG